MPDPRHIYLSKSDFIIGRLCPKRLWLEKREPQLAEPPSPAALDRMETGSRIGELARGLYPEGVLIERGDSVDHSALLTQEKIQGGADCLFEATFVDGARMTRVDVLRRLGDVWALDEVKSSTAKDPKELLRRGTVHDVEFQSQVLESCGLKVAEKSLVLINGKYDFPGGDHDLGSFFTKIRVDEECSKIQFAVEVDSNALSEIVQRDKCPDVETNLHCDGCPFYDHCHVDQPKHSVTFLPGIRAKKVDELRKLGYPTIDLIPDDYELDSRMALAREVVVSGKPYLGDGLGSALSEIRYPAAFVDFESFMPAIPTLPNTRPYQQICFQWSAHILDSPNSESRHYEFLFDGLDDPRLDFCRTLYEVVRDCKTILFYTVFEKVRLKEMADKDIPYASQLLKLFEERGVDLHAIVKDHVYLAEFKGRTSIKTVLPALVPDLSYEGLAIADGNSASSAYQAMKAEGCSAETREQIRHDLLEYCKLDTLAMVRVQERLRGFLEAPPAAPIRARIRPEQFELAF